MAENLSIKKRLTKARNPLARRTRRRAARLGLEVKDSYSRGEARHMRELLAAAKTHVPDKLGPTQAQKRAKRAGGPTTGQSPLGGGFGGAVAPASQGTSSTGPVSKKRKGRRGKRRSGLGGGNYWGG